MLSLKASLHVPSLALSQSLSPSNFNILPMMMDCLTDKRSLEPILSLSGNFMSTVEVFTFNKKLQEMAMWVSMEFTSAKKVSYFYHPDCHFQ